MTTFAIVRISQVIHRQREAETSEFPARAVAFLQQHPPAGPIFNLYDWGGYLIWKLYPTTPVFIDGRADLYGADLFHDFADVYQFKGRWQQILHRWHIQTVIVPPTSALAVGLQSAPGWTVSYQDSQAVVLTNLPSIATAHLRTTNVGTAALGCPSSEARFPPRPTGYSRYAINYTFGQFPPIMVYILNNPPQSKASNR